MTFDDIKPYDKSAPIPKFLKTPSWALNFLGEDREGKQNGWGKALNWIPGLNLASTIGNASLLKQARGTGAYNNIKGNTTAAGIGFADEALTAGEIAGGILLGQPKFAISAATNLAKTISKGDAPSGKDLSGQITNPFGGNLLDFKKKHSDNTADPNAVPQTETGTANATPGGNAFPNQFLPPELFGATGNLTGFKFGGTIKGPSHKEGGIALIDTKTGKDMGIRVEGGEKIVNAEDFERVKNLLGKGHHKKALSLLESIEMRGPKSGEMSGGGTVYGGIDIDNELNKIDVQIEKQKKIQADKNADEQKQEEARKTAEQLYALRGKYQQQYRIYKMAIDAGEPVFSKEKDLEYKKGLLENLNSLKKQITNITGGLQEGATLNGSPTMKGNYSNATDAVYKNGKWYHTQGDNKGAPIDEGLQQKLTDEYFNTQKPAKEWEGGVATRAQADKIFGTNKLADVAPQSDIDKKNNANIPPDKKSVSEEATPETPAETGIGTTGLTLNTPNFEGRTDTTPADSGTGAPADKTTTDPAKQTGNLKDILGNAAGYGFDALRLGLGTIGATKKLPEFKVPSEWADYVGRARYLSNIGISPEEKAEVERGEQSKYGAQVNNIVNASGGNAGVVLGNLNALNQHRASVDEGLAAKDAELKQENFKNFLPVLNEDIGFKKDEFNRKYQNALATKESGAHLMSDALSDINGRYDHEKAFGTGSAYDTLQKTLIEQGKSDVDLKKYLLDYYKNHPEALTGGLTGKKISENTTTTAATTTTPDIKNTPFPFNNSGLLELPPKNTSFDLSYLKPPQ